MNEVDQNVKYWVRPDIMNRIRKVRLRAYPKSKVKKSEATEEGGGGGGGWYIFYSEGKSPLQMILVMAMTGYKTNFLVLLDNSV